MPEFIYWNGKELVRVEVDKLKADLLAAGLIQRITLSRNKEIRETQLPALARLREIFDVQEYKDGGLSEHELAASLNDFWAKES